MTTITVKTQAELDTALKNNELETIYVESGGTWLTIRVPDDSEVEIVLRENSRAELRENSRAVLRGNSRAVLRENSRAELWGNSHAELWGNSHAVLWENSRAVLWENSRAELWGNSHAELRENSRAELRENSRAVLRENSRAELWENSRAELWGNSHAELRENSRAVLRGNSRAVLRENSRAELWGNSHAELWGNSHALARHTAGLALYERSTAKASPLVCVHIHDPRATAEGGHQIVVPPIHTVREWADYHGLVISKDGELTVFKAVGDDLKSPHGAVYSIGTEVEAADWNREDCCGYGLHFSATPREAMRYFSRATRFLACRIHTDETVVIDQGERGQDKVKARRCVVLHEVDIDGEPLAAAAQDSK
ncbi:hypothetical protein Dcar01_03556 [Deinococcus carri]|uniref:DUF7666 domain-containing protein n=1 Tax=Deinococcus carri TaxID=1211323 RepID=A0ABP9WDI9_9DEIO